MNFVRYVAIIVFACLGTSTVQSPVFAAARPAAPDDKKIVVIPKPERRPRGCVACISRVGSLLRGKISSARDRVFKYFAKNPAAIDKATKLILLCAGGAGTAIYACTFVPPQSSVLLRHIIFSIAPGSMLGTGAITLAIINAENGEGFLKTIIQYQETVIQYAGAIDLRLTLDQKRYLRIIGTGGAILHLGFLWQKLPTLVQWNDFFILLRAGGGSLFAFILPSVCGDTANIAFHKLKNFIINKTTPYTDQLLPVIDDSGIEIKNATCSICREPLNPDIEVFEMHGTKNITKKILVILVHTVATTTGPIVHGFHRKCLQIFWNSSAGWHNKCPEHACQAVRDFQAYRLKPHAA